MRPADPNILARELRQQLIPRRRSRKTRHVSFGLRKPTEGKKLLACPSTRMALI